MRGWLISRLAAVTFGLSLMAAALHSCGTDQCIGLTSAMPKAGFFSSTDPAEEVTLDSLDIIAIGQPSDQSIIDGYGARQTVYLPFRIDRDTTVFVISYRQEYLAQWNLSDTLTFCYDRKPYFPSADCGAMFFYEMKEIKTTHWLIDSVTCPGDLINNADMVNINIYFRVAGE